MIKMKSIIRGPVNERCQGLEFYTDFRDSTIKYPFYSDDQKIRATNYSWYKYNNEDLSVLEFSEKGYLANDRYNNTFVENIGIYEYRYSTGSKMSAKMEMKLIEFNGQKIEISDSYKIR